MSDHYYDRRGKSISRTEWKKLCEDSSYVNIREFDNGRVKILLEWVGKITNFEHSCFEESWPLFRKRIWNYDSKGVLRPDPALDDMTYPTELLGIDAYESFLEQWTDCHFNDKGTFVEVGNDLTPPPPPDPDIPTSEIKSLPSNFVAW